MISSENSDRLATGRASDTTGREGTKSFSDTVWSSFTSKTG
jgi:hypothetical protein